MATSAVAARASATASTSSRPSLRAPRARRAPRTAARRAPRAAAREPPPGSPDPDLRASRPAPSRALSARQQQRPLASWRGAKEPRGAVGDAPPSTTATRAIVNPSSSYDAAEDDSSPSSPSSLVAAPEDDDSERVGVLLLNLGGPERLADVQPFLFNLFADPDIIRLPPALRFLQAPLATLLSASRAPKSKEAYESIGGGSPLRRITDAQAAALKRRLRAIGAPASVYVGMRYWKPFTEDACDQIKADRITKLVVLPLYPQFSISTSGSSLRLLEKIFGDDEYLQREMTHTVIPSWYQRPGYVAAMAELIAAELRNPARGFASPSEPVIFFSAHGVPVSYVEEAGDPYKEEMEECVRLIVDELRASHGVENEHVLAYQSRVGPVEWLKPYTDDTIRELGERGCEAMVAVPISFVSEHIETLEEIDMEYRELAEASGVKRWGRVPALDTNQTFIDDLADAVVESLESTREAYDPLNAAGTTAEATGGFGSSSSSSARGGGAGAVPPVPAMPAGSGVGARGVPDVGDLLGVKPEPWQWGALEYAFIALSILLSTMLLMDGSSGAGLNEKLFD